MLLLLLRRRLMLRLMLRRSRRVCVYISTVFPPISLSLLFFSRERSKDT
jgi:hypothetical protein